MVRITLDSVLDMLLENAYEIADEKKLYGIRKKLSRNHEPDFLGESSFENFIDYTRGGNLYVEWIDAVSHVLDRFGLQSAKFRVKINEFDPKNESNLPAQLFIRAVKEVELINNDKSYRKAYLSTKQLPAIMFSGNILTQGDKTHRFNTEYSKLVQLLWSGRKIINSKDKVIQAEKPTMQSMVSSRIKIELSDLSRIQKGLISVYKKDGIYIKLSYPRGSKHAYLVVMQDVK